jgi:hypothetical protein
MMHPSRYILHFFLILIFLLSFACQTKRDGSIEGTIVPLGVTANISAVKDGKTVMAVSAGAQDGKFKLVLPAGTYAINVATPASLYPLNFNGIIVKPGETTTLPPIELAPVMGKATLSGRVIPPSPGSSIKLLSEGQERAAVQTDKDGKYEFKELPAGTYLLQASAPGHADDATQVVIAENQNIEQNAVLFPIVAINGVDWASGKIRSTGVGLPPQNATNETVRRAMAQRAALADAQRNMLRTIEQIRLDSTKDVKTAMNDKNFALKIQGFIKGYTVISDRDLDGGKVEVILELPLTGTAGLSRYISE